MGIAACRGATAGTAGVGACWAGCVKVVSGEGFCETACKKLLFFLPREAGGEVFLALSMDS